MLHNYCRTPLFSSAVISSVPVDDPMAYPPLPLSLSTPLFPVKCLEMEPPRSFCKLFGFVGFPTVPLVFQVMCMLAQSAPPQPARAATVQAPLPDVVPV